ncbi:MAG: FHA domain-containing protein, partial [Planctomycetota bacterium]
MGTWYLKPIRGSAAVVKLGKGKVSIGRHPDNVVPITDDLSSRFHCEIEEVSAGTFVLKDLGSKNGTKVNEAKVMESKLKAGDVIRVGHHEFLLENDLVPDDSAGLSDSAIEAAEGSLVTNADANPMAWTATINEMIENLPPKSSVLPEVTIIDSSGKPSQALSGSSDGPAAVRLLLHASLKARSTDVHIEPKQETYHTRFRVDGQMITIVELPMRVGELFFGL